MRHCLAIGLAVFCLGSAARVSAQSDHLKCYKIKDTQAKAKYTADLGGLVAEPGCVIKVPAIMACVPATKTNVDPAPPGSGSTGTATSFGCYKVKCPKAAVPSIRLDDQFGSRTVTPKEAKLLCAPARPFTCGDSEYPQCGGVCPGGQVCQAAARTHGLYPECSCDTRCECVDPATACDGQPCPSRVCVRESCLPIGGFAEYCESCGSSGDLCESDTDCCCGSCSDHPVGAAGFCQGSFGDPGCPARCQ